MCRQSREATGKSVRSPMAKFVPRSPVMFIENVPDDAIMPGDLCPAGSIKQFEFDDTTHFRPTKYDRGFGPLVS